jgi:hypothetical protein
MLGSRKLPLKASGLGISFKKETLNFQFNFLILLQNLVGLDSFLIS